MNKVILLGRLARDPEVRYSQGVPPMAVSRYTLAVNRTYHRDGEPKADFINIVAFGSRGEFAGKYFRKGMMVAVVGELRISSYDDKDGNRRWSADVVVNEQYFTERKQEAPTSPAYTPPGVYPPAPQNGSQEQEFDEIEVEDADLPF